MTRFYSEYPEYSQISKEEKELRDKLVDIIARFTEEMENYSYFGSNPGVPEDSYEDIAEEILLNFIVKEKTP